MSKTGSSLHPLRRVGVLQALAGGHLRTLMASSGVRAFCTLISCPLGRWPCGASQHDGADHRDQQHHAGDLEVMDYFV